MFSQARLKLTTWYLVILMLVSGLFSTAIYKSANNELERLEIRQQLRIERFHDIFQLRPDIEDMLIPEPVADIRHRLIVALTGINIGILFVGGLAAYFLAGETLKPIQDMVDDQNRFITDASHELRTPITALKTELEVSIRDKKLTLADARNLLQSNLEETNMLQAITENLLNLAQLQKPSVFAFEKVRVRDLIDNAIEKVKPMAKNKNIDIQVHAAELSIPVDKERFTEVFVILLDNAIKYSNSNTTVTINAKTTDHSVIISVHDQGIGIDKSDLPHIFDRFFRAEKSRSKEHTQGYGLGLSIAKKIIEAHKGTIIAKSPAGGGTTFYVRIPESTK